MVCEAVLRLLSGQVEECVRMSARFPIKACPCFIFNESVLPSKVEPIFFILLLQDVNSMLSNL